MGVVTHLPTERSRLVEQGRRLEYVTIAWNSLEALAALISGLIAGSVALVGFGLDSLIEVTSGAALLWRLHRDQDTLKRKEAERITLRVVGSCFLVLAGYIAYDSISALLTRQPPPKESPRNRRCRGLVDCDALAVPSEKKGERWYPKCCHGRRCPSDRLLRLSGGHLTRRFDLKRAFRAYGGQTRLPV